MNWKETVKTLQYLHRDLPGCLQLGILLSHAEGACLRNCTVEQPRNQVSEMHFDKFQCFKTSFKTEECSFSGFLWDAVRWIKEVEMVESVDELRSSQSM